jgi:hypothetical protein
VAAKAGERLSVNKQIPYLEKFEPNKLNKHIKDMRVYVKMLLIWILKIRWDGIDSINLAYNRDKQLVL